MRRTFLASLASLLLAGCTIVVPLEQGWTRQGEYQILRRGRLLARVWQTAYPRGWHWQVVDPATTDVLDRSGAWGLSEERAKQQAEAALARHQ